MSGSPNEIVEGLLAAIQGRKGTKKHQAAIDELWKLAEIADEKNRPARERKRAAEELASKNAKPGEAITLDMTPEWRDALPYLVHGATNGKSQPDIRERMLKNLRNMAIFALNSEVPQ